jgi:hypothetical protein
VKGSEHYREGERLLSNASWIGADGPVQRDGSLFQPGEYEALIARARTHFAAAEAAATALRAVLPLVGGDCTEVTEWARAIGALEDGREDVVEAVILPVCWPPIAGDAWTLPDGDPWGPHPVWFAQSTPDGVRMLPTNTGEDITLSPEDLLKRGELKLLHRNPWEAPF